jgi:hypothetical protein
MRFSVTRSTSLSHWLTSQHLLSLFLFIKDDTISAIILYYILKLCGKVCSKNTIEHFLWSPVKVYFSVKCSVCITLCTMYENVFINNNI